MMDRLDRWFLDQVYQRVADWFSGWVTCFGLARAAAIAAVFCTTLRVASAVTEWSATSIIAPLGLPFMLVAGWAIGYLAKHGESEMDRGHANPYRLTFLPARRACLVVLAVVPAAEISLLGMTVETVAFSAESIGYASAAYFLSCQRSPPKAQEVPREAVANPT